MISSLITIRSFSFFIEITVKHSFMEEGDHKEDEVTILDKDENSDRAVSVVGGFVIEESTAPFPVRERGWW